MRLPSALGRPTRSLPRFRQSAALVFLVPAMSAAWAQSGRGSGDALAITPTASITQTITDNALLSSTDRRSDVVTQLSAGVSMSSRSGRVQGSLDYQLSGSIHARGTEANNSANSLRAAMNAELVDQWLFLDASASIGQQSISAFGLQTNDTAVDNPNQTEVRSFTLTPSMRGRVGTWANYSAQLSHTQQSSAAGSAGDSTSDVASVALNSSGGSRIGWGVVGSRQRSSFDAGRSTVTDSLRGNLNYSVNSELRLSGSIGRDSSDVLSNTGNNATTWGWGVDWIPSERTNLSVKRDHRFFGDAHSISFDHRVARSNWHFSSSRDLSTASPTFVNTGVITYYDLLYANAATIQPDPVLRRQLVLQQLALQNINPNTVVGNLGFQSSAVMLVSRQDFSFALQGLRSSVTFSLNRSDSRRIDGAANVIDDLSTGSVRQQGFNLTLGHRLTPISGLNLTLSQQRVRGSTSALGNDLQSINLTWTSQLGQRSNVSLGARHVDFDSATAPYTESAIFGTLSVRF